MAKEKTKPVHAGPHVWIIGILGLLVVGLLFLAGSSLTGFFSASVSEPSDTSKDPTQYLSREVYFKEAFTPERKNYDLFEAASAHTGIPLSQMPRYFGLQSEDQIFEDLPAIPTDFSEIAFLLARGSFFDIGSLTEGYYKQPEFYPDFTNPKGGLRWWREPDPTAWGTNGYGSYPAEQWTTLKRGQAERFEATIFLYSSWGVQTFQGVTLFADPTSEQFFDLIVSPDTFVLEPSFPAFHNGWAQKVTVRGSLKPNTLPGDYLVAVNVGFPPQDKQKIWGTQYRNLYQNAASGIRPAGNQIELHIRVE